MDYCGFACMGGLCYAEGNVYLGVKMRFCLIVSLLMLSVATKAAIIEFETNEILFLDGYSESGFDFSVDQPAYIGAFGNDALLGTPGPGISTMVLTNSQSLEFDLVSFDVGNLQNVFFEAEMVGNYSGGGQIQTTITVNSAFLETMVFDQNDWGFEIDDWTGLSSLVITVDNTAYSSQLLIDNININVVPIPAAAWLFGSALAGLGWMRRKQTI